MPHMIRAAALAALLLAPAAARAEDVSVMISGGFKSTYGALLPAFEAASGDRVTTLPGPSMGDTPDAIPQRLARGEPDDVLIMVGSALDGLIKDGKAVAGSKVDLALSPIGMAVKAGAPVPDISTVDKLRAALLAAKSVAYSDSASGVYVGNELFARLGIAAEMKNKARMIPATPVAEMQKDTVFSAGIAAEARHPDAGRALIAFMASSAAAPVMAKMGLDPAPH